MRWILLVAAAVAVAGACVVAYFSLKSEPPLAGRTGPAVAASPATPGPTPPPGPAAGSSPAPAATPAAASAGTAPAVTPAAAPAPARPDVALPQSLTYVYADVDTTKSEAQTCLIFSEPLDPSGQTDYAA